jgi:hypothetical protein
MILYFAADLFWATRIREAAAAAGVSVRPVRNPEMLRARLGDSPVKGMVVDLDAGEAAVDLIKSLRGEPTGAAVKVVAWGPHVEVALLGAAKAAGADAVMARGAFSRRLGEILVELEAGRAVGDEAAD